jgi:uncharacterized protein (DUF1499 family)
MKRPLAHRIAVAAIVLGVALCPARGEGTAAETEAKTLRPCPSTPNCISTLAAEPGQRMAPIPFTGARESAQMWLRKVILAVPRAEITEEGPGYLAAEFRSRLFGFVDEAQFLFDEKNGLLHFRSGARTGWYDFGVNRSRMERIGEAFRTGR